MNLTSDLLETKLTLDAKFGGPDIVISRKQICIVMHKTDFMQTVAISTSRIFFRRIFGGQKFGG